MELAALECLNAMPVPVAPRLLGADAGAGILLLEDLEEGRRSRILGRCARLARP